MFFKTKNTKSKNKFEGIIEGGFKAIILGGFISVSVVLPMLVYILRHAIEAAFTANVMHYTMIFLASFSFFCVIMGAFIVRSVANAYIKAQALNAMATKQQASGQTQPQIIIPQFAQSEQPKKKQLEAKGGWALNDVDQIPVIEATSQMAGKPFVF